MARLLVRRAGRCTPERRDGRGSLSRGGTCGGDAHGDAALWGWVVETIDVWKEEARGEP